MEFVKLVAAAAVFDAVVVTGFKFVSDAAIDDNIVLVVPFFVSVGFDAVAIDGALPVDASIAVTVEVIAPATEVIEPVAIVCLFI